MRARLENVGDTGAQSSMVLLDRYALSYPRDHFIGAWWSGAEPDVLPAGDGAISYKSGAMHAAGATAATARARSSGEIKRPSSRIRSRKVWK